MLARNRGIGASESSITVDLNPWNTKLDLWKLKTGKVKPKDISSNESVSKGIILEPVLRNMFMALHPEYDVSYNQYDMLYQEENPWLYATLDGELTNISTGEKGILEIKTSTPRGNASWREWSEGVPTHYYIQCLHQMIATGWSYAILFAALFEASGNISIREYEIRREDAEDYIEWLFENEKIFWDMCKSNTRPPLTIKMLDD